jgi:hypothetical protein
MLFIRYLNPLNSGKEGPYDSFFAGLVGGYTVFGKGRQGSVNKQVPHLPTPANLSSISQTNSLCQDRDLCLRARHARPRPPLRLHTIAFHPSPNSPNTAPLPRNPRKDKSERMAGLRES